MVDWFSSGDSKKSRHSLLYGVLIGAFLVATAWLVVPGLVGSGPDGTARSSLSTAPGSSTGPSAAPAAAHSRNHPLARCREVYTDQQQPLEAAASSMSQWQVHIAAMNKLVLGVISLDQAMQFWSQTRVGAKAKLRAFDEAIEKLGTLTIRCPTPGTDTSARTRLVRCERAVAADGRVLDLAKAALATWAMHVQHMEMLREGKMSPEEATRLWMQSWHEGQAQVTAYHAATKDARSRHCSLAQAS